MVLAVEAWGLIADRQQQLIRDLSSIQGRSRRLRTKAVPFLAGNRVLLHPIVGRHRPMIACFHHNTIAHRLDPKETQNPDCEFLEKSVISPKYFAFCSVKSGRKNNRKQKNAQ